MGDLEELGGSEAENQSGVFLHKHKSGSNSGAW